MDGVVVMTEDVLTRDTVKYWARNVGSMARWARCQRTVRQAVLLEKLTRAGIDPNLMVASVKPVDP